MQTMATCKLLEEAGHTVNLINLIHPKIPRSYKRLTAWTYLLKDRQFLRFKKKYFSERTKMMFAIDNNKIPFADYTIVGSDQSWNRDITRPFALSYFLDFADEKSKRIALSASFGKDKWIEDTEYTKMVKNNLSKFRVISVRENSGVEILQNTFNINGIQVVDPTLAYNHFDELVTSSNPIHQVFCFMLGGENAYTHQIPADVAKTFGIVAHQPETMERRLKGGPLTWLHNMKNSEFIITDSFHGLAFCLMFHKQFIILCADINKFTRLRSLLQLVHLENRFASSVEDYQQRKNELLKPIDYAPIDEILTEERLKFKEFIKDNIF